MTLTELREKTRVAQITKDLQGYVYAIEDYCKTNNIDVWQITRRLMELIEKEQTLNQIDTVLDLARVPDIETLNIYKQCYD